MASSLIGGLIGHHHPASQISVSDLNQQNLDQLKSQYSVNVYTDNLLAIASADPQNRFSHCFCGSADVRRWSRHEVAFSYVIPHR